MIGLDTDMVWKSLVFDRVADTDGCYADPDPILEKKTGSELQKKNLEMDSTLEKNGYESYLFSYILFFFLST